MSFHRLPHRLRAEVLRLTPYAALVAFCLTLVAFRVGRTGSLAYVFLTWNLVLAVVPVLLTSALRSAGRVGERAWIAVPVLALWVLFLPNAPYILTDLIHLGDRPPVPMWYDLLLLLACAGTGLALAYRSLFDAEALVQRWVRPAASVAFSVGTLFLCGFGVYLGRYGRLNSWEVVSDPSRVFWTVLERLAHPMAHRGTWGVTILLGVLLSLGYAALRSNERAEQVRAAG